MHVLSPCAQSRLKLQSVANPVQNTANALLAACVGPGTQQIRFACGLIQRLSSTANGMLHLIKLHHAKYLV